MADGDFNVVDVIEADVINQLYRNPVDGDECWKEVGNKLQDLCWTKWLMRVVKEWWRVRRVLGRENADGEGWFLWFGCRLGI